VIVTLVLKDVVVGYCKKYWLTW